MGCALLQEAATKEGFSISPNKTAHAKVLWLKEAHSSSNGNSLAGYGII